MNYQAKKLFFIFFLLFLGSGIKAQQINLIRFNNSANYTPGSGVSVIMNPTGVFDLNNQFILELSNPGGTFTSPTILNTLNEFYVPVINGTLPNGLAAGSYKLRIRSTNPALSIETNSFNVVSGGGIQAPKAESTITANSNFINCLNCSNEFTIFGSLNRSDIATVGSGGGNGINLPQRDISICGYDSNFTYTINLISKIDVPIPSITTTSITHTNGIFTLPTSLGIGTYIFEIQKSNTNSTSVYSIVFLFHGNATSLGNSSSEQICINENVTFAIDKTITGIGRNYYGSKYNINFGDGTIIEYTHAQLLELTTIDHTYTTVSCNENNGSYLIRKELFNKGINNACATYSLNGNGVTKNVNTSSPPTANFEIPLKQCINTNIFADNTTIPGSYGANGCLNEVLYYWYYKRPGETTFTTVPTNSPWINSTFDLTIPATSVTIPGCWEIKLLAVNPDFCQIVSEMIKTIKIEAVPTPTFTNTPQSPICAGTSVLFTNTSNVLNIPCQEPVYSWTVTPVSGTPATSTGYQFIAPSSASSQNADIKFIQPGSYSVVLNITNSCGTFASTPRIIEVFGDPTVSFNPNNSTICDAAPAGYTIDFSQAGTQLTYSVAPYAPTNYNWSVSGPGVTSADYAYVGGTNANSQYPKINFIAFKTYSITVQVNGNCAGSNQASFTFTLKEMPVITNSNLTQSICTGGTTSPINLTSSMASDTVFNWVVTATNGITGFTTPGSGSVIPATTLNNPTNTTGTVTYTVTPSNNGCVGTPVNFVITVNPAPLVPAQVLTTCSGNAFTVALINNPPSVILPTGTTFTWTVSSPAGINGASNQTTPVTSIGQTLVNTTNAPIDVVYTITATTGTAPNTCSSTFILTVTVNPRPQIPNQTLSTCSGNYFNLSLVNTPPSIILPSGTTYTWTVSAPAGITGASNQTTPVNTIGQTLINSTSNPINVIYNITATSGSSSNACSSNFTLTVTVNPAPSATISGNASVCQNSNNAIITFTGLNGVAPYTFTYSMNGGANQTISTTSGNSIALVAPTSTLGTFEYCLKSVVDASTSSCLNTNNTCVTVVVNPLPTVSTQPTTTQSICVGGTIDPLTVAYSGGVGTATYQWYSNTTNSNSGGTLIAGATNSSYTPTAFTTAGTYYFYATITLSGNNCGSITSNTAQVIVLADPIVTAQAVATQTLCQSSTPTDLTITISGGIGTYSYQWYSNTSNSTTGGTLIAGATNATFTPPTTTVGTQYYYCVVTQSGVGCNVTSAVSTVIIVAAPAITTQPASSSVCENGTPTLLTVAYTNGTGTPTYQWFSNTTNSTIGGTAISGATTASYNPPATIVGTLYYYCEITFSSGGCTSVLSNTAQVVINPLPTVATQPTTTQSICVGGIIEPLTVAYTGGVGTATYQWYSNTTNSNSGGTLIAGATNSSYTPAAFTTVGTYYFYATITLSGNNCGSITSNTAEVIVVADPIVNTQALATQSLCQSSTPTDLTITISAGIGTYSYQWYSNTSNSPTAGTAIPSATNATFTPPTATVGTRYYYCVVTQSGVGCNVTSAVSTVIIVAAPAITTQPASSSVCENGTPSLLTVAYTNGTGTPTYQWFSNTTNSTIGGTAIPGATSASYNPPATTVGTVYYYCEITFSSGGCTSVFSNTAQVVINPLPTVSTQPTTTQSICVGGTITPLAIAYSGGVGTATYQWYSNTTNSNSGGTLITGATNSSYTPAAFTTAGTYYFYATITLSGNGCGSTTSNTAEVIVVADPIVDTQALATQTLCQNSTPTDLTITVSGGIGTFAYQWYSNTTNNNTGGTAIPSATNATFTPPTAAVGTRYYYCVVTQSGVGCNVTSAVSTVIIVAAPAITTQPASSSVCENGTPSLLTVAYTNGTGTPTYQWFSNTTNSTIGGTAIAGATSASYNPPATTVGTVYYYCEITFSSGGCTSVLSNTAEVVINQIPVVSSVSAIICSGEQYIFNSTNSNDILPAGLQYSWNLISMTPGGTVSGSVNNGTLQNQFIQQLVNNSNGISTLVYEVTPIASICSGNPFTITIEVYPKPDVTFDIPIQTICNETNTSLVTLNSTLPGNITFEWNATIPSGITAAVSSGTNIIPVQTLINSTNAPLTITYSATATFNNNGASCEGNVFTYSITVNPTFSSSGVLSNYNGYNVSVFGANDGSIDLTTIGGSGTYTYNWSGPNGYTSTNEDISGLFAGTYTVTINDGYCAPIVLAFTLSQPPELLIQPDLNLTINLVCFGDNNGAVGVLITQESVPPYDYELYNSSGNLITSMTDSTNLNPQFTGLIAGVYSLTVIDANGGRKTVTGLTVTQPDDIIITATTTPITCYGANNASIRLTVTGGTGPYQAQWNNLATGFYQNNLAAGDYTILVTDSNGCTKTIIVNIPEAPIFTINPVVVNISCYGANDGSINLNLVGGIQPIVLTWSDGSTAGLVRNNLAAGTYTVTIVDAKPCSIVRTFIILEPQPLILSANVQDALDCNDANSGNINLLVSGGTPPFTYKWSNTTTTEDLINIPSGNYAVMVTDSRGCTKSAQYSVNRPQPLTLKVTTDTDVNCETKEIIQVFEAQVTGGIPPIQLSWSSGTVSGPNMEFMTTNQNGLVIVTAKDAIGCTTNYSLNVDIPKLGNASFNQTSIGYTSYGLYSILDPIQFTNTATGDFISVIWDFGDGTTSTDWNPTHTYLTPKNYTITQTVTYPFGCKSVNIISISIEKGYVLVIPNAFTPDNDKINDFFRPVTKGLEEIILEVYDTWGSLIYKEIGDSIKGWDGKINGVNAENGNYHYNVIAKTFYGKMVSESHPFVLIK